ncbi:methyl-accepting chemotaxis protein [Paraburkholderia sediminicola]|uniref:methyl-accepting chemotaxis protein n=1 Tax=Paraburkholderia sediminicola TaxID=458836 RepID=UPI0038B76688
MSISLRTKASIACAILVLLSLTILSGFTLSQLKDDTDEQNIQRILALTQSNVKAINMWIARSHEIVASASDGIRSSEPVPSLRQARQAGSFLAVYAGLPNKTFFTSREKGPPATFDPTKRPWFIGAAESRAPFVATPYLDVATKKLIVTFATPVYDGNNLLAVLGGDVSLDDVVSIVNAIKPTEHSLAFLVGPDDSVVAANNPAFVGKRADELTAQLSPDGLSGLIGGKIIRGNIRARPVLLTGETVQGTGWHLVVALDQEDAYVALHKAFWTTLLALLCLAPIAAAVAALLMKVLMLRLGQVCAAMEDIGSGDGDLSRRLPDDGSDEVARIANAFNVFSDKLEAVLNRVRSSSLAVGNGAAEISTGSIDLSSRTEEQAASLSETASSMEQLTSAVDENARNASNGKLLATQASASVGRGVEAVAHVVETIGAISSSSSKIESIITMIEGISFQTNILALNAAVEAARAGEHGRGFAVVAAEVRSLAQRSATAAKEVKALIDDTVHRVNAGESLAAGARRAMDEIQGTVSKVSEIMVGISGASEQQSAGISQVALAITQMDVVTQQNAALVEQASAAAASLSEQANELQNAIGSFRLSHRTSG